MKFFGLHPTCLLLSTIRHDAGLCMVCVIVRKCLCVLRQCLDRHLENEKVYDYFDALWQNKFYSNPFSHGEVCSIINGSHVAKFVNKSSLLGIIFQADYEENECFTHCKEALLLLPKLMSFWKKVKIERHSSYMLGIIDY